MPGSLSVEALPARETITDGEVTEFLEECPASFAQQTPGWREVVTSVDRDEPLFLGCRAGGKLVGLLPGYRFEGPLGAILCSVSQAGSLGGVVCHPGVEAAAVYRALLSSYVELGRSSGCALTTVVTNPIWPDRSLCERFYPADYTLENWCQVLDLEEAVDEEGRIVGASSGLRRNLRKAEAGALSIDETQSLEVIREWYEIHTARHGEIGAEPLPRGLFEAALEHLVRRGKGRFFFVRRADSGEMTGGGLYVHHRGAIDALMPSVCSEHADLGTGFLLAVHSMRWARARGIRFYNWQASPPGGGVYRFKRQWGSRDFGYAFLTRVTGDAEPFLRSTVPEVRKHYRWHYALPFDRIGAPSSGQPAPSTREAVWQVLESSRP